MWQVQLTLRRALVINWKMMNFVTSGMVKLVVRDLSQAEINMHGLIVCFHQFFYQRIGQNFAIFDGYSVIY